MEMLRLKIFPKLKNESTNRINRKKTSVFSTSDMYPKFLIFKLPNVLNRDASSIPKRLLRSAINKRNKELKHVSVGIFT